MHFALLGNFIDFTVYEFIMFSLYGGRVVSETSADVPNQSSHTTLDWVIFVSPHHGSSVTLSCCLRTQTDTPCRRSKTKPLYGVCNGHKRKALQVKAKQCSKNKRRTPLWEASLLGGQNLRSLLERGGLGTGTKTHMSHNYRQQEMA